MIIIPISLYVLTFKEPKRTKDCKARKLLARKKRNAFINRQERHEQKEKRKCKSTTSVPHVVHEQNKGQTLNNHDSVPVTTV